MPFVFSILSRRSTISKNFKNESNRGIILRTSMEFGWEFYLGLNELEFFRECQFGKLNAKLELATLIDLVFILNIGVHIAEE